MFSSTVATLTLVFRSRHDIFVAMARIDPASRRNEVAVATPTVPAVHTSDRLDNPTSMVLKDSKASGRKCVVAPPSALLAPRGFRLVSFLGMVAALCCKAPDGCADCSPCRTLYYINVFNCRGSCDIEYTYSTGFHDGYCIPVITVWVFPQEVLFEIPLPEVIPVGASPLAEMPVGSTD